MVVCMVERHCWQRWRAAAGECTRKDDRCGKLLEGNGSQSLVGPRLAVIVDILEVSVPGAHLNVSVILYMVVDSRSRHGGRRAGGKVEEWTSLRCGI